MDETYKLTKHPTDDIRNTYVFDQFLPKDIQLTIFSMARKLLVVDHIAKLREEHSLDKLLDLFRKSYLGDRELRDFTFKPLGMSLKDAELCVGIWRKSKMSEFFSEDMGEETYAIIDRLEAKRKLCPALQFKVALPANHDTYSLDRYWDLGRHCIDNFVKRFSLSSLAVNGMPDDVAPYVALNETVKLCLIQRDLLRFQTFKLKGFITQRLADMLTNNTNSFFYTSPMELVDIVEAMMIATGREHLN